MCIVSEAFSITKTIYAPGGPASLSGNSGYFYVTNNVITTSAPSGTTSSNTAVWRVYNEIQSTYILEVDTRIALRLQTLSGQGYTLDGADAYMIVLPFTSFKSSFTEIEGQYILGNVYNHVKEAYITYHGVKYYGVFTSTDIAFRIDLDSNSYHYIGDGVMDLHIVSTVNVTTRPNNITGVAFDYGFNLRYDMVLGYSTYLYQINYIDNDKLTGSDIDNQTNTLDKTIQQGNQIAQDTNNTTKSIFKSITDFFGSFFQNLINAVVSLFVPSADEMSGLFNQLNQFFSDRFGFLYAPFDYFAKLLGVFTSATGSTEIIFPGFSILGYEVWSDIPFDLSTIPLVNTIFGYVRTGTGILLSGYFIMFLQDFFKERFGSG